ncbi:MAG TPA: hypothetical protein DD618_04115 [Acholeplasmatales bacterium]|nr:hypothetical protein [Acholeplasmatales bacterium]
MKILKKFFLFFLVAAALFLLGTMTPASAYNLVSIPKASGIGNVTYRNTSIEVKMPEVYVDQATDFRAVWVSPLVGDIAPYASEAQYKEQIFSIFETMEYFNMNALIFHVRMNNDALYPSLLNPVASAYQSVDFAQFDPLEWIIDECHKRGIEFHAWLNPYRVGSGTGGKTLEEYAATFPDYNIAHNAGNLLQSTSGVILNPGEVAVRKFIIDTCMEIIENYDVDAIHFDDYFYISGVDDAATRAKYNINNLSIADFRREQVNLFIEGLSTRMREYNLANNRYVQLGISPTGIYRNGSYSATATYDANGNLLTPIGSNTAGFSHYDAYLYCDTKKWVDNEWIDYILPQSYWSMEDTAAPYADIMDWWVKAVKNKNVNLYSGMGLYMVSDSARASWYTNPNEAGNQVQFSSQYPEIQGHCVFSYSSLKNAYEVKSGAFYNNMNRVKTLMWKQASILPEIRTMTPVNLPAVSGLLVSKNEDGYILDFNALTNAKFYVLYRSAGALTFDSSEIIEVVGDISQDGVIRFVDETSTTTVYNYGVKALSKTNTLGAGVAVSAQGTPEIPTGTPLALEAFTGVYFSDYNYFNGYLKIRWNKVYPLFGEAIGYEVRQSKDGETFTLLDSSQCPITDNGGNLSARLPLDATSNTVWITLRAFNNLGETVTDPYAITVTKRIGNVANFTVLGEVMAGKTVTFIWNQLLKATDVTYKVQRSDDEMVWTDITGLDNPVVIDGANCRQEYLLPSIYSNQYYRVVAANPDGFAISENLRLESFVDLGDLVVSINGIVYDQPIIQNEGDILNISWNALTNGEEDVVYKTKMSANLNYWSVSTSFNAGNSSIIGTTQTIAITFRYYIIFYQIEATAGDAKSFSPIVEIWVNVTDVTLMQFMAYMSNSRNVFLNRMDIYR